MNFRVGQKVVCVDASPSAYWRVKCSLVEGQVYTVHKLVPPSTAFPEDGPGVLVVEAKPEHPGAPGFRSSRFRPVVERKTDISIFTKLLTPSPSKVSKELCGND